MKLIFIFVLFTLSVIVEGNLVAVAQPAILALGTMFTALYQKKGHQEKESIWKGGLPKWKDRIKDEAEAKKLMDDEKFEEWKKE